MMLSFGSALTMMAVWAIAIALLIAMGYYARATQPSRGWLVLIVGLSSLVGILVLIGFAGRYGWLLSVPIGTALFAVLVISGCYKWLLQGDDARRAVAHLEAMDPEARGRLETNPILAPMFDAARRRAQHDEELE